MAEGNYYQQELNELSNELKDLLDVTKQLPESMHSYCVHVRDLKRLKTLSFISIAVLLISMGGIYFALTQMGSKAMNDGTAPMVAAVLLFISGYCIYFMLRHCKPLVKYGKSDFMKMNLARFGYFFTKDGVLARRDFEDCHLIPYREIKQIEVFYDLGSNAHISGSIKEYVSFVCTAGEVVFYEDQYMNYDRMSEMKQDLNMLQNKYLDPAKK